MHPILVCIILCKFSFLIRFNPGLFTPVADICGNEEILMDSTHPEERVRRMIIIIVYVNLMSSNYLEGEGGFAHRNYYLTLLYFNTN